MRVKTRVPGRAVTGSVSVCLKFANQPNLHYSSPPHEHRQAETILWRTEGVWRLLHARGCLRLSVYLFLFVCLSVSICPFASTCNYFYVSSVCLYVSLCLSICLPHLSSSGFVKNVMERVGKSRSGRNFYLFFPFRIILKHFPKTICRLRIGIASSISFFFLLFFSFSPRTSHQVNHHF